MVTTSATPRDVLDITYCGGDTWVLSVHCDEWAHGVQGSGVLLSLQVSLIMKLRWVELYNQNEFA